MVNQLEELELDSLEEDLTALEDELQDDTDEVEEVEDPVSALEQRFSSQLEDLRRTVGRVQSMAAKIENGSAKGSTVQELSDQFQSTSEQLAMLVSALDESVIDPDMRARLVQAQQQARDAAVRTSLKNEILQEVESTKAPPAGDFDPVQATQAAILAEMASYGVDPNDDAFDWSRANALFQAGDTNGLSTWLKTGIREALAATSSDGRRQAKKGATKGSPKAAAPAKSTIDRVLEDGDITNLDEAVKILRDMNISI